MITISKLFQVLSLVGGLIVTALGIISVVDDAGSEESWNRIILDAYLM
jgi:hypothetical protein